MNKKLHLLSKLYFIFGTIFSQINQLFYFKLLGDAWLGFMETKRCACFVPVTTSTSPLIYTVMVCQLVKYISRMFNNKCLTFQGGKNTFFHKVPQ